MACIDQTWCIAIIGWIGCIVAFLMARTQWRSGQKVQRAEFLERLVQKFKDVGYDSTLRLLERSSCESDEYEDGMNDSIKAYDFLVFLSYVCYLKQNEIIDNNEFVLFESFVERALKVKSILNYITPSLDRKNASVTDSPYIALIEYGRKKGLIEGAGREILDAKGVKMKIKVNENKVYRTHLDVLNGIFDRGILQHMKGSYKLDDNTVIWFPRIYKTVENVPKSEWANTINADGSEILERWNGDRGLRFIKESVRKKRYVFAHFEGNDPGYRFLGVFECIDIDEGSGLAKYKKINDHFEVEG